MAENGSSPDVTGVENAPHPAETYTRIHEEIASGKDVEGNIIANSLKQRIETAPDTLGTMGQTYKDAKNSVDALAGKNDLAAADQLTFSMNALYHQANLGEYRIHIEVPEGQELSPEDRHQKIVEKLKEDYNALPDRMVDSYMADRNKEKAQLESKKNQLNEAVRKGASRREVRRLSNEVSNLDRLVQKAEDGLTDKLNDRQITENLRNKRDERVNHQVKTPDDFNSRGNDEKQGWSQNAANEIKRAVTPGKEAEFDALEGSNKEELSENLAKVNYQVSFYHGELTNAINSGDPDKISEVYGKIRELGIEKRVVYADSKISLAENRTKKAVNKFGQTLLEASKKGAKDTFKNTASGAREVVSSWISARGKEISEEFGIQANFIAEELQKPGEAVAQVEHAVSKLAEPVKDLIRGVKEAVNKGWKEGKDKEEANKAAHERLSIEARKRLLSRKHEIKLRAGQKKRELIFKGSELILGKERTAARRQELEEERHQIDTEIAELRANPGTNPEVMKSFLSDIEHFVVEDKVASVPPAEAAPVAPVPEQQPEATTANPEEKKEEKSEQQEGKELTEKQLEYLNKLGRFHPEEGKSDIDNISSLEELVKEAQKEGVKVSIAFGMVGDVMIAYVDEKGELWDKHFEGTGVASGGWGKAESALPGVIKDIKNRQVKNYTVTDEEVLRLMAFEDLQGRSAPKNEPKTPEQTGSPAAAQNPKESGTKQPKPENITVQALAENVKQVDKEARKLLNGFDRGESKRDEVLNTINRLFESMTQLSETGLIGRDRIPDQNRATEIMEKYNKIGEIYGQIKTAMGEQGKNPREIYRMVSEYYGMLNNRNIDLVNLANSLRANKTT